MEEFKNGVISEEALGEIAGGLKISASTVKKVLAGAGVGILALGAAGSAAGGGYLLYNRYKKSRGTEGQGTAAERFKKTEEGKFVKDPEGTFTFDGTNYVEIKE